MRLSCVKSFINLIATVASVSKKKKKKKIKNSGTLRTGLLGVSFFSK